MHHDGDRKPQRNRRPWIPRNLIELRNDLGSAGHLSCSPQSSRWSRSPSSVTATRSPAEGASFRNYALIGILLINTLLSRRHGRRLDRHAGRWTAPSSGPGALPHGTTAYAISKVLSHFSSPSPHSQWRSRSVAGHGPHGYPDAAALAVVAPAGLPSLLPLASSSARRSRSPRQLQRFHQRHAHRSSTRGRSIRSRDPGGSRRRVR